MSFEVNAEDWVAWARRPGHDSYWYHREAFFDLLPPPGRAALEVGCGEGRVSRDLAARGYAVTALDLAPSLLAAAREAHPTGHYVLGDAARLPFADASFDLVVAYNSLMDVDDMPGAVAEMARVLQPGGHLGACVTHPLSEAGRFESREPDASFVISGSYFGQCRCGGTFERNGLSLTLWNWCYPLEAYAAALEDAGLLIEAMREPEPTRDYGAYGRHSRVPEFLLWRASKA